VRGGSGTGPRATHETATPAATPAPPAGTAHDTATQTIAIVGNPNVGKSVLFKNLTRHYVAVSNFPGTTVEVARARANFAKEPVEVIDTPGVNDLAPHSDDARVTRRLLDGCPDDATLVQVADAKNLRRALLLTLQLAELGRPMVLVLNMFDELEERGGKIDLERLETILGVPVVATVAVRGKGTRELIAALGAASVPHAQVGTVAAAEMASTSPYRHNRARLDRVNEILAETYSMEAPDHATLRVRLGFWSMDPLRGPFVLAAVMVVVLWFVGLFGAGTLVELLEVGAFEQHLSPIAIEAVDAVLPFPHTHEVATVTLPVTIPTVPPSGHVVAKVSREVVVPAYTLAEGTQFGLETRTLRFLHDFLVGRYGVITMALSYALAIVLPIVTTFFLAFGILEDSGYFSRMAILVHRTFKKIGLNGKAVLPMILGLGCDTMATMTTRILETRRERIITTMLLALAVPCSAQLGVLLALMARLSPPAAALWVVMMVGVMLLVGWMCARLLPGEAGDFILEIPPLRRPILANVAAKTLSRLSWYLKEVIPLFVLGTAALFVLDRVHVLGRIASAAEPLVTGWLGLPSEMANAFLVGFLRRDFGAVYILDAATGPHAILTPVQIFVAMITITLFIPCVANFLVIAKEHGARIALGMAAFIFPFAFFVGGMAHWVATWLSM